ncbi:MAG: hypothetical protein ACJASO_000442 [Cyclobacteriaceae bacterium]
MACAVIGLEIPDRPNGKQTVNAYHAYLWQTVDAERTYLQ